MPRHLRRTGVALAQAYDMVLNGSEIGGGSVRIHSQQLQSTVFDLLGISAEEAQRKLASCSMHCDLGHLRTWHRFGLDRLAMLMAVPRASAMSSLSPRPRPRRPADRGTDGSQRSAAARAAHPRQDAATGQLMTAWRWSTFMACG